MNLKTYLAPLPQTERVALAVAAGTTFGHLRNVGYRLRPCSPELAAAIERATRGAVMRWDMRPHDWRLIWPELQARADAPVERIKDAEREVA
ncbi:YdaS family helix-turn-helix protein [Hydrogenophaga atypica]|uniref:YdaS family helix-turn-helix protein n=1 Tax=Hydrogenophaga atypica TaxID=249409 RepID=A0ABW2QHY4_9BURK